MTSNISPMNEFIRHEDNGILVDDYTDPNTVSEAIKRAIFDTDLRTKLKANGPLSIFKFSKHNIDKWEVELYRHVLQRPEPLVTFQIPFNVFDFQDNPEKVAIGSSDFPLVFFLTLLSLFALLVLCCLLADALSR